MQPASCFPKARSVPYLLGIVFRLMSDSSPLGSQTPSPIGKCPLLQVNSKKYTAAKVGKENYTSVTERSLHRRISQKWGWHRFCTPLLTHEWETYMALQENIYGRQRECIWNIYGTQATVNSRTRDGSLGSQPWWGNCDDRCGDNHTPVLTIGGADWRKEINSSKKRTLGLDAKLYHAKNGSLSASI